MRTRKENQEFHLFDPQVREDIAANPVAYFSQCTIKQLKLFNSMLKFDTKNMPIYMRQDTMGKRVGFTREHVNRFLGQLIQDGIIASNYRHKTSCIYKVSSFFSNPIIRAQLRSLLYSLAALPLSLICSSQWDVNTNVTQTKSSTYLYTYNLHLTYLQRLCKGSEVVKKEGERVEEQVNGIPSYINDIESPVMTYQQKMQLAQYNKQTVKYALIQLQRSRDIQSPVGFLLGVCRKYTDRTKSSPVHSSGVSEVKKERKDSMHQPKELRGVDFWKRDSDKMAHWSVTGLATHLKGLRVLSVALEQMLLDKYKAALASHTESTCELCQLHGPDYQVEFRSTVNEKSTSVESHKAMGGNASQVEMQAHAAFMPDAPRSQLAQVALRQLQIGGMGQNAQNVAQLTSSSVKEVEVERMAPTPQAQSPEIQSTFNEDEPEPNGGYDESEYDEIFT
jgi:hypothetical protein